MGSAVSPAFKIAVPALVLVGVVTGIFFLLPERPEPRAARLPELHQWDRTRLAELSPAVTVDFYLDASNSMAGFITPTQTAKQNYFRNTLEHVDSILQSAWRDVEVAHWRFDRVVAPIAGGLRPYLKDPVGSFRGLQSRIDLAADHGGKEVKQRAKLKIILTDLFQTNDSIGALATVLNKKYMTDDANAVMLLGVRNVFSGPVEVPQVIEAKGLDSLPFYLVVAGPVADVQRAVDALKRGIPNTGGFVDGSIELQFIRRMVPVLSRPLDVRVPDPREVRGNFQKAPMFVDGARERGIPELYLSAGEGVSTIDLVVPGGGPKPVALPGKDVTDHLGLLLNRPGAFEYETAVTFWAGDKPMINEQAAREAFEFDASRGRLLVHSGRLRQETIYLFQLDLVAREPDLNAVSELDAWSLDDPLPIVEKKEFPATPKGDARPGKTLGLRRFLSVLSSRLFQQEIPLARYHLLARVN